MAGNNQYGKIQLAVKVDKRGVNTSLKSVEKSVVSLTSQGRRLANLGAQLRGLGEGVNRLGRRMTAAGAALSLPLGLAIKQAGQFEKAISSIKVNIGDQIKIDPKLGRQFQALGKQGVSGAKLINKEYKDLERTFKSLARNFPRGPGEIAGAATQLARAGISKSLIQGQAGTGGRDQGAGRGGILRPLVQLSVADTTGATLEEVTDKSIKLLKAFNLLDGSGKSVAETASQINTSFATILKASTQANVSVLSLAESMKFAGGILATTVNQADDQAQAFREIIAVTSILQERLGDASIAGTALRGMLLRLRNPTGEVAEKLEELGFGSEVLANAGKSGRTGLLGLLKAIEALRSKVKIGGATEQEFEKFISGIFDNRQVTAALSLVNEGIDNIEDRIGRLKISGSPEQFFNDFEEILNDNVVGAAGRAKSAIEILGTEIGGALSDATQGALKVVGDLADTLSQFARENPQLVRTVAVAVGAFSALGVAVLAVGGAISTFALPVIAGGLLLERMTSSAFALTAALSKMGSVLAGVGKGFKALNSATALPAGFAKAGAAAAEAEKLAGGTAVVAAAPQKKELSARKGSGSFVTSFAPRNKLTDIEKQLVGIKKLPVLNGKQSFSTLPIVAAPSGPQPFLPLFNEPKKLPLGPDASKPVGRRADQQRLFSFASGRERLPRRGGDRGQAPAISAISSTLSKGDKKFFKEAASFGKTNKKWQQVAKRLEKVGVQGARGFSSKELMNAVKNLAANLDNVGRGATPSAAFPVPGAASSVDIDRISKDFAASSRRDAAKPREDFERRQRQARRREEIVRRARQRSSRDTSTISDRLSPASRGDFFFGSGSSRKRRGLLSGLRTRAKRSFTQMVPESGLGLGESRGMKRRLAVPKSVKGLAGGAAKGIGSGLNIAGGVITNAVSGLAMMSANLLKVVAGVGLVVAKFSLLGAAIGAVVVSGGLVGNVFDAITSSFRKTGEAFGKSFKAIGDVLNSLKFENAFDDGETAGNRINKVLETVKASAKAIFLSLATEVFSGIGNVLAAVVSSLFEAIVNSVKGIFKFITTLGQGGGGDPFAAIQKSLEDSRDRAFAELDRISADAKKRTEAGEKAELERDARFFGVDAKTLSDDQKKIFDEQKAQLRAGAFGDPKSEEAMALAGMAFKEGVESLDRVELQKQAEGFRESIRTAGDELRDKLRQIREMQDSGVINSREANAFRSAASAQFRSESPIFKAAKEHQKAAEELKKAGMTLTGRIDPRVALQEEVGKYSDLLASGAISLKTFREAVRLAEIEQSERLDSVQETLRRDRGDGSRSQVGSGQFFSKFSSLLGAGQDEGTLRKNNLKAQIDAAELMKKAGTTIMEGFKNSEFGKNLQVGLDGLGTALNPARDALLGAANALKESAKAIVNAPKAPKARPERADFSPTIDPMKDRLDAQAAAQPRSAGVQSLIQNQDKGRGILEGFFGGLFFVSDSDVDNMKRKKSIHSGIGSSHMGAGFAGFRANGGGVSRGKSYVVGEKGPELFFPTENGHILSNDMSKKVDGMFAGGTVSSKDFKEFEAALKRKTADEIILGAMGLSGSENGMSDFGIGSPGKTGMNLGGMTFNPRVMDNDLLSSVLPLKDKMASVSSTIANSMASESLFSQFGSADMLSKIGSPATGLRKVDPSVSAGFPLGVGGAGGRRSISDSRAGRRIAAQRAAFDARAQSGFDGNRLVADSAFMPNAAVDASRAGANTGSITKNDIDALAKDGTIKELIGKVGELIGKVSTGGLME